MLFLQLLFHLLHAAQSRAELFLQVLQPSAELLGLSQLLTHTSAHTAGTRVRGGLTEDFTLQITARHNQAALSDVL